MTFFFNFCFNNEKKKRLLALFPLNVQNFRLHLNSGFLCCLFSLASFAFSLTLKKLGQHSFTGSYPPPAASSFLFGLLKLLPTSILLCHRGLAANKLLTLLAVIKNRKAFSPLSCKPFFLLATDSPKQTANTKLQPNRRSDKMQSNKPLLNR